MSEDDTQAVARTVAVEVVAVMSDQGVTQQVLADRLGWNQQRLSRRLTDGKSFVAFTTGELLAVATALEVPATRFLPADSTPASAA